MKSAAAVAAAAEAEGAWLLLLQQQHFPVGASSRLIATDEVGGEHILSKYN